MRVRRRSKAWSQLVCAFTVIGALAGCGDDDAVTPDGGGTDGPPSRPTMKIGLFYPATGALAPLGEGILNAGRLAVQQVNAEGGLLGRDVILVETDDESNAATVAEKARNLIETEGVVGIVNPVGSETALAVAMLCGERMIPQVACCTEDGAFTTVQPAGMRYSFRTTTTPAATALLVHRLAVDAACMRVAIVYAPGGADFNRVLAAELTASGAVVVAQVMAADGLASYATEVTTVAAATPDCVVTDQAPASAGTFIKSWSEQSSPPVVKWFGVVPSSDSAFLSALGDPAIADGMVGAALFLPRDTLGYRGFETLYRAAYGAGAEITPATARGYDAAMLLLLAIARAGSTDGAGVRDALIEVSKNGATGTDRPYRPDGIALALNVLRDGTDIDYDGASGPVDLNACGSIVAVHEVWRFDASLAGTPGGPFVSVSRPLFEEPCP